MERVLSRSKGELASAIKSEKTMEINSYVIHTNASHIIFMPILSRSSLDEVRTGITLVQETAKTAIEITENILKADDDLNGGMKLEGTGVEPGQTICGTTTAVSEQIQIMYDDLQTQVDELTGMIRRTLSSFGSDLKDLITLTDEVESGLDSTNIFFYIMITISVIIVSLIVVMLAGVFFSAKGFSNCFTRFITNAVLWPVFIFFLILFWAFATLFLVASLAGADFCVQPDEYVQAILNRNKDMFDGVIFGFIIYYISVNTMIAHYA